MSRIAVLSLFVLAVTSCGGDSAAASAAATPGAGAAPSPATGAAPSAAGAARSGGSIVLSSADLHTVARELVEEGVAISGGLRPIETISVRARLEGDVLEVAVREGDRVRRGTLLARFEDTEQTAARASAEADRLAAELDASTARWNFEQTQELFRAGAIPEREFRVAEQAAAASAARLAAAEARLRTATLAERDTRIVAPADGIIERRSIERGVRAQRGMELFTLVRTETLELTAAVPARRAGNIAPGQAVRFTSDGRAFEGSVARVSPTIDPTSQSITVYVQVPNADGELKGNAFATGQIIERGLPDQLAIPQPAVRQAPGGGEPFVWRLAGGSLERVGVKLGIVDEVRGVVQVLDGLAVGDRVVVGNVGMMGVGMQVQLIGGEGNAAAGAR